MKGKVLKFNKEKGYGFIKGEDEKDIFFHWSSIVMDGYKFLNIGDEVEFDLEDSERGPRANNIHKVEAAE